MKRSAQRNREFSTTRLSYSRQHLDQTNSRSNLSPSNLRNHESKSLLCNNCFNRQLSTDKKVIKKTKQPKVQSDVNTTWAFYENIGSQKNQQAYKQEIRKVNEYNVNKIRENQIKNQIEKQELHDKVLTQRPFEPADLKNKHKGGQIRQKLREDLQKQIAIAKERRIQARKQTLEMSPGNLIEEKPQQHKKEELQQQYKRTLMEQIREQKIRKQQQTESRKNLSEKQNNLSFVKVAEEKRVNLEKLYTKNKQQLQEELKRKKQIQIMKKNNALRIKEQENKLRFQEEQRVREQKKINDDLRRANIQNYLQDLRQQIQQNKLNRREQFNRLHTENVESIALMPVSNSNICSIRKMENCSCCTKAFPKQYLSPYSRIDA